MTRISSPDNMPENEGQPYALEVLLAGALPRTLTYKAQTYLPAGQLVEAPLGAKTAYGVVLGPAREAIPENKIKFIKGVLNHPPVPRGLINFLFWVSDYCMTPAGNILSMVLGGQSFKEPKRKVKERGTYPPVPPHKPELSAAQAQAAKALVEKSGYHVTLLDGVTGSGKTEVYCEAIEKVLSEGKQVLVLLPEIALSTQITQRLTKRFGFAPTLWHSELTPKDRRENWKAIIAGDARLVIGARSALFLPYALLGLIVVDEEHDGSYKQDEGVIYHGRDMAIVRAKIENMPIVLSSATPSVETWVNVKAGKYQLVHLPERHGQALLPDIKTIDLRLEKMPRASWISPSLQKEITQTLARNEQVLLFLNRRGFAPLTLCRQCGHRFTCPQCSAWLVEHRQQGKRRLVCHHCDFGTLYPDACPQCKATDTLVPCGPGVERLDDNVKALFPNARRAILTSDTLNNLKELQATINAMERGEIDILIGTQMVAKGYHFPRLTLVGVVDGDLGLQGGDLRAAERTFQLLTQVAGRSGRADAKGTVLIQTTQPEHAVMKNLVQHNRDGLLDTLMNERKLYSMPPFARLATLTLSGTQQKQVEELAAHLARIIPTHAGISVLGPAPAPMALLRGRYRLRFLLKAPRHEKMQDYIRAWLSGIKLGHSLRLHIDIDPYQFV